MAVLVVDALEVVQVHHGQGQRFAAAAQQGQQRAARLQQVAAVVCTGQRVFQGLCQQLLLQPGVLGNLRLQFGVQRHQPGAHLLRAVALLLRLPQAVGDLQAHLPGAGGPAQQLLVGAEGLLQQLIGQRGLRHLVRGLGGHPQQAHPVNGQGAALVMFLQPVPPREAQRQGFVRLAAGQQNACIQGHPRGGRFIAVRVQRGFALQHGLGLVDQAVVQQRPRQFFVALQGGRVVRPDPAHQVLARQGQRFGGFALHAQAAQQIARGIDDLAARIQPQRAGQTFAQQRGRVFQVVQVGLVGAQVVQRIHDQPALAAAARQGQGLIEQVECAVVVAAHRHHRAQ